MALAAQGFVGVDPPADADRSDYTETEVRYAAGAQGKAQLVAAYLGVGKLVPGGNVVGSDVTVVLGRDFTEVTAPTSAPPTTQPSPTTAKSPSPTAKGTGGGGGPLAAGWARARSPGHG